MKEFQGRYTLLLGGAYIIGFVVSSIHLSRFGVYDLAIAKISYISSGMVCLGFLAVQVAFALALVNHKLIFRHMSSTRGAIHAALKQLGVSRQLDRFLRWVERRTRSKLIPALLQNYTSEGLSIQAFNLIILTVAGLLLFASSKLFDLRALGMGFSIGREVAAVTKVFLTLLTASVAWLWLSPAFRPQRSLRFLWRLVFGVLLVWHVAFYSAVLHPILRPAFGGGAPYKIRLEPKNVESESVVLRLLEWEHVDVREKSLYLVHESPDFYYLTDEYQKRYGAKYLPDVLQYGKLIRLDKSLVAGY
jgi:hypothetical protein